MTTFTLRALAAGAAVAATLGLSGCGLPSMPGGGDWRTEARCQPPGGGWGPEHVLPDPVTCPEAYRGDGRSGSGWVPQPEFDDDPYVPSPTPPCSRTESLNGFHCENVDPWGNPGPYYP